MTDFIVTTDKIDEYPDEVMKLLHAIGHPEALVTDLSQLSDFIMSFAYPEDGGDSEAIEALGMLMSRRVEGHEYLHELAKELHERRSMH